MIASHSLRVPGAVSAGVAHARSFLRDEGVRAGIRLAIACNVALYLALLLRLEDPVWAVTTAYVLMLPKFVGAIAEKTVLRITGAAAGAVIGYLITGSLQQNPILFLLAYGLLLSFTTAMFGGTLAPYGFHQMGYTALLVGVGGLASPADCWSIGLYRCEEICLGIVVASLVTALVWPRFARVEFLHLVRQTLTSLGDLLRKRADQFRAAASEDPDDVFGKIGGKFANLRSMIVFGSFESRAFLERRPQVDEIVLQLTVLSTAVSNLSRPLPGDSVLRKHVERETHDLHNALLDVVQALTDLEIDDNRRRELLRSASASLDDYHHAVVRLREHEDRSRISPEESFVHGGYALSIQEVHSALQRLAELIPAISRGGHEAFPTIRFKQLSLPPPEWIQCGIRGALAVITALIIDDWLRPPGGEIMVVGAYLYNFNALSSPNRMGDLGVFSSLVALGFGSIALFLILLVATPLMASYAVWTILFSAVLFVIGYVSETTRAGNFARMSLLLLVASLVGLNAQYPVPFESVVGAAAGLTLAATISVTYRRLFWPSLPQKNLRTRIDKILALLESAAAAPDQTVPVATQANLALGLAEALSLTETLRGRIFTREQAANLSSHLGAVGRLGGNLLFCPGKLPQGLPEELRRDIHERFREMTSLISRQLAWQRTHLAGSDQAPPPEAEVATALMEFRDRIRSAELPVPEALAVNGYLYRTERCAEEANLSTKLASRLDGRALFQDWRL